jgi:branched-subunit amino acid ABC-type transport system permease component
VRSLLPFLIGGLVTGSLYGMAGLGLVLSYRTSGVFNFGHGAIAAGAAFVFYSLHFTYGWPWPLAALITVAAFAVVVGWIMERITRGLGDVPEAVVVLATVGVLLAVQGLLFLQYGATSRAFPEFLPTAGFTVAGVNVSWAQVISFAVATAGAVLLYLFLQRSRLGVAMRAVVDNPTLVALSGDRPLRVRQAAWAIGSGFAALSGILLAPTLSLDAGLLTLLVIQAFGACALGLFSSLPRTYLGGLAVGVAAAMATRYLTVPPWNGLPPAVPFLILVAVLLVVPSRRFPARQAATRRLVSERPPVPFSRTALFTVVGLVALVAVPAVAGTRLPLWTAGLTNVLIFASLALLVWTSGQISLCHASFVALGASTMGHLTSGAGVPWPVALLLAGLLTVPIGLLVAVPAIRLSGVYLALATFGFALLMQQVMYPSAWMFGFDLSASTSRPRLGPFDTADGTTIYYVVLAVVAVSVAVIVGIGRSRLGRLLRAMAETPTMLMTHGLGVSTSRLLVLAISAFFAGMAGALQVTQFGAVNSLSYGPIQSLLLLAALATFGTRLLRSSVLAAASLAVVPQYVVQIEALRWMGDVEREVLVFGAVAIVSSILIAKREQLSAWMARWAVPAWEAPSRVRDDAVPAAARTQPNLEAVTTGAAR